MTEHEQKPSKFETELASLLNRHSMENGSDTPDFILAQYLTRQLEVFNEITNTRKRWYGDDSLLDTVDKALKGPTPVNAVSTTETPKPYRKDGEDILGY